MSELKLGNGTSLLIFANIASSLPTSLGATVTQAADTEPTALVGCLIRPHFFLVISRSQRLQNARLTCIRNSHLSRELLPV